jgi:gluconate 2-dehydrogenase gamma chain
MPQHASVISRREALRRTALLLGGVVSAPALAGVLAGCETPHGESGWTPRALTSEQTDVVATIAEHILPETDTPGARAVGVHRFIDTMLAEHYGTADRATFLRGLGDIDARAARSGARNFIGASKSQQIAILTELDREAYSNVAAPHFFRTMKELTLLGYYTSEAGATKELQYNPAPGRFEGCVPISRVGRAWAV